MQRHVCSSLYDDGDLQVHTRQHKNACQHDTQHAAAASDTARQQSQLGCHKFQAFFMVQHLTRLQWACATGFRLPNYNRETSQGNAEGNCMQ